MLSFRTVTLFFWTIGSVLAVSSVSLVGVFLLTVRQHVLSRALPYLVAFATGAMLGNVFLHLLPEAVEKAVDVHGALLMVLLGMLLSFVLETFIHWHHCHDLECTDHRSALGPMVLFGDGIHNLADGILIASSYLVSVELGIATTFAVMLHELPQEIGDVSILLQSGYTKLAALGWNLVSAFSAVLGAGLVLLLKGSVDGLEQFLVPLTAGNFLYIAGSDLVPELHRSSRRGSMFLQFIVVLLGVYVLYLLSGGTHGH